MEKKKEDNIKKEDRFTYDSIDGLSVVKKDKEIGSESEDNEKQEDNG